jgi:hypothetical protein
MLWQSPRFELQTLVWASMIIFEVIEWVVSALLALVERVLPMDEAQVSEHVGDILNLSRRLFGCSLP